MPVERKIPTFFWEYRNRPPDDVDLSTYRLRVGGDVEHPLTCSLAELEDRLEPVEVDRRFYCVNGWSLCARWQGFPIAALLELVQPKPGSDYLRVTSLGGYDDTTPISRLVSGDAMLVTHMDGEPLSVERGKPMRMMLFDMYQFKGVKAVGSVDVVADYRPGFWETVGYSQEMAEIQPYPHLAVDTGEELLPELDRLTGAEPVNRPPRPRRGRR